MGDGALFESKLTSPSDVISLFAVPVRSKLQHKNKTDLELDHTSL